MIKRLPSYYSRFCQGCFLITIIELFLMLPDESSMWPMLFRSLRRVFHAERSILLDIMYWFLCPIPSIPPFFNLLMYSRGIFVM
jgi:hypothetical protein